MSKLDQMIEDANKLLDEQDPVKGKNTQKVIKRYSISLLPAFTILCILWGLGVVVAKGFWATVAASFIPFIGPGIGVMWLVERFTGA